MTDSYGVVIPPPCPDCASLGTRLARAGNLTGARRYHCRACRHTWHTTNPTRSAPADGTTINLDNIRFITQDLPMTGAYWADAGLPIPGGHTENCVLIVRHSALGRRAITCETCRTTLTSDATKGEQG